MIVSGILRSRKRSPSAFRSELSVDLRRASDRLPGRVAALHVLGIESSLPQRGRSAASDVKSVNAEHYHRIRFRQFTRPLLHALRVAPDRAFDDVLRTGYVVPRTRIDELDQLAFVQHRLDIFHRDSRQIGELFLHQWARRLEFRRILVTTLYGVPVDVAYEGVDVGLHISAEVNVIGVLVHVESQDRDAARDRLTMVARILVYEPAISRNIDEQYPAGSARQAVRHGDELIAPAVHRSEIGGKRPGEHLGRPAVAECQAREIKLVEQRGIEGDKLLAF